MYHPGCLPDLMSAAAPRWQASITRDATNIFLSLKRRHLILKPQSMKSEQKLCKCQCVPCRWRIAHPCNTVILLHMVGRLQHPSSDASISALRFWDTPLKDTTCALLMLHTLLILVQTPLHNLQNSEGAEHLSKLLWLFQASQNLTSNSTEMWRMPSQVSFVIISCAVCAKNNFHSQVQACRALFITVAFKKTIRAAEQDNTFHTLF